MAAIVLRQEDSQRDSWLTLVDDEFSEARLPKICARSRGENNSSIVRFTKPGQESWTNSPRVAQRAVHSAEVPHRSVQCSGIVPTKDQTYLRARSVCRRKETDHSCLGYGTWKRSFSQWNGCGSAKSELETSDVVLDLPRTPSAHFVVVMASRLSGTGGIVVPPRRSARRNQKTRWVVRGTMEYATRN